MNFLDNLKTNENVKEEGDVLGRGFQALETGLYPCTVEAIFIQPTSGGAVGLRLHLALDNGQNIRQTLWMTSGTAKGGRNTYTDSRTGEERYLPGFVNANHLSLVTTGNEIAVEAANTEEKVINLWNPEARAEVATKVNMLEGIRGKRVILAIQKTDTNKRVKVGDVYKPTAEVVSENEIVKVFSDETRKTVAEIQHGADEDKLFIDAWNEKNAGVTRDRVEKDPKKLAVATQGAPATTSGAVKEPTKSLFG